jgi:hypothetical protein
MTLANPGLTQTGSPAAAVPMQADFADIGENGGVNEMVKICGSHQRIESVQIARSAIRQQWRFLTVAIHSLNTEVEAAAKGRPPGGVTWRCGFCRLRELVLARRLGIACCDW